MHVSKGTVTELCHLHSGVTSSMGGFFAGTEWGMVALGIFLGAGLALIVGYTYLRVHERYYGGISMVF